MKCQQCDKPAVFHITELETGEVREVHLCEDHARAYLNQTEAAAAPDRRREEREALDRTEAAKREMLFVSTYIRRLYRQRGVAAVLGLMDPEVVRAVRTEALLSLEWLNSEALLFGFLVACALWLLADLLRRP